MGSRGFVLLVAKAREFYSYILILHTLIILFKVLFYLFFMENGYEIIEGNEYLFS